MRGWRNREGEGDELLEEKLCRDAHGGVGFVVVGSGSGGRCSDGDIRTHGRSLWGSEREGVDRWCSKVRALQEASGRSEKETQTGTK